MSFSYSADEFRSMVDEFNEMNKPISFIEKIALTKESPIYEWHKDIERSFYLHDLKFMYEKKRKENEERFMYMDTDIQKCIANTAIFREELMQRAWHPKRVVRLMEEYGWSDEA